MSNCMNTLFRKLISLPDCFHRVVKPLPDKTLHQNNRSEFAEASEIEMVNTQIHTNGNHAKLNQFSL